MIDRIPLASVPREIRKLVVDTVTVPSYRQIYAAVLDGVIPAERENGRWFLTGGLQPTIKRFGLAEMVEQRVRPGAVSKPEQTATLSKKRGRL